MIWQFLLLAVLVACSFVVSGSETALFALSRLERRNFSTSGRRVERMTDAMMAAPHRVLMTVLIVNTAINVCIFAVSYVTFGRLADDRPWVAAGGGVATLVVVILFGEIIPKTVALANARWLAPVVAPLIRVLQIGTSPLQALLRVGLVDPITRLLAPVRVRAAGVATEDLQALVELSAQQGIISSREHNMLHGVVALREIPVRSVMVPRVDVQVIGVDEEMDEVRRVLARIRHKKLPVFGRDADDIRGLLYARDVYLKPRESVRELMRPVQFVPEVIDLLQLLEHFRNSATQMAVVVDEYGGVSGLVTLEDVLEQIVGEIEADQGLPPETPIERIDEETYRLSGALSVRPWRQLLGITRAHTQVDTIGGVVVASLGRLPCVGDEVRFGDLSIVVDRVLGRRVDSVLLKVCRTPWEAGSQPPSSANTGSG